MDALRASLEKKTPRRVTEAAPEPSARKPAKRAQAVEAAPPSRKVAKSKG